MLADGVRPAVIRIDRGRITAIGGDEELPPDEGAIDAGELVVMPGLVDVHVHVNEPGRTEWEGFDSASRAAAAGGVTTIVDMPLNSIPATTTVEGLHAKRGAAAERTHVDYGFWGGVVPGNTGELAGMAAAGALGFKCFLAPSGVDEFPAVSEDDLRVALPILARLRRPLLVHAELPAELRSADPTADPRVHATWLDSRPVESERAAVALLIRLASHFRAHIHVVHLSSGEAAAAIAAARAEQVSITAETCPHYLTFAAEEIPEGATPFKCAPPIRTRGQRDALWRALGAGHIDLIATDHSPAPPAMKCLEEGDFLRAWGGVASLQLGLRAVWTGAAARGIGIAQVSAWMASNPARLAGLRDQKGTLAVGMDADVVIWDPEAADTVDAAELHHRHPVTPYHGMPLGGRVHTTILRGEVVYDARQFAPRPLGREILRRAD